jgi:hypothetical protein
MSKAANPGWLRPKRLEYVPLDDELAVVRVVAGLARGVTPPAEPMLVAGAPHTIVRAPVLGSVSRRPSRRMRTADHLLWRVTFALPLELIECPQALFALVAQDHMPARLPEPTLSSLEALCRHWDLGVRGAGLITGLGWRRAAAVGTAVAVAGSSALPPAAAFASVAHTTGPAVPQQPVVHHLHRKTHRAHPDASGAAAHKVASGDRVAPTASPEAGHGPAHVVRHVHAKSKDAVTHRHHVLHHRSGGVSGVAPSESSSTTSTSTAQSPASGSQTAGLSAGAKTPTRSVVHHHHHIARQSQTSGGGSGLSTLSLTPPPGLTRSGGIADGHGAEGKARRHHPATGEQRKFEHKHHATGQQQSAHRHHHATGQHQAGHHHHHATGVQHQAGHHHHATGVQHHAGHHHPAGADHRDRPSVSGGAGLPKITPSVHRAPPAPQPPADEPETSGSPTAPTNASWTTGTGSSSAEVALLSHLSGLFSKGMEPPSFLVPIYKKAGKRFHIPWEVLAAINLVETDYGRNLNVSSAGAEGWMQFEPSTWAQWGMSVNGKGLPNPYDPTDAIFSAARYLAANGAAHHLRKAIFAYNHAGWYVDLVMWRAQQILEHVVKPDAKAKTKIEAMLTTARLLNGLPYIYGGGHGGWGPQLGYDCSGFVSAVLHAAGYLAAPQDTQTLPDQPEILPGPGKWVTMYDRTDGGALNEDHVIIDIDGHFWESGGSTSEGGAARVHPIADISLAYLATFNRILHPRGL